MRYAMKMQSKILCLSPRTVLLACALLSFSMLTAALVGQYGFGLYPCDLCIYQRIPYTIIVVIGVFGWFCVKNRRWQYIMAIVCAFLFLIDAGIAGYHAGVESGIFKGPTACSSNGDVMQTLEQIRASIRNAPLVTCSQAMVHILGLSMAAWNMIAATLAFLATSFILIKNR